MQFDYIARDSANREVRGQITAASRLQAANKLFNEQKLTLVEITQVKEPAKAEKPVSEGFPVKTKFSLRVFLQNIDDFLIAHSKISTADKAIFFQLLSAMISAGLPIIKALEILSEQTNNKRLSKVLKNIALRVSHGERFSQALGSYERVFSESEIGTVAVGEASGQLAKTLTYLATELEKSNTLKKQIYSAMIYPILVMTILAAAIFLVMIFVIPKLDELFAEIAIELPLATQMLINISNWFIASSFGFPNWLLFLVAFFAVLFGVKLWRMTTIGNYLWDKFLLNLPIFGSLIKKAALAEFARQLSLLTLSGVPIIRALEITASAIGNEVFKRKILNVRFGVERGRPIYKIIENDKLFPKLITSMIAVGEQTAQLGIILEKVANIYEEEVKLFTKNLSTIIEPLVIVILATFIIGFIVAVMGPILKIMDFVSTI